MKKTLILSFLLGIVTFGYTQPKIKDLSYPSSVNIFDLYEITFQLGAYTNPYDPEVIDVYAEFTAPDGKTHKVNGFYYEGYYFERHRGYEKSHLDSRNNCWKVRFTPDQVGSWRFALYATDKKGRLNLSSYGGTTFIFNCKPVCNASGFITKANSRYLKRDVITDGKRQSHSFFPVGPNVAWYVCKEYYNYATPYGIYEYERRIDSLAGNANYMRLFINRPQYLSLYGYEYTQLVNGKPTMYFDKTINQKDAAELDHIVSYAAKKNIAVMLCFFTYGDLKETHDDGDDLDKNPQDWRRNPYHTVLGLKSTMDFFTDKEARRITKNLIRYIVSRWGYATNVMAWELWNEVTNMDFDENDIEQYSSSLANWHKEMTGLIHANDPFGHMVSTSLGKDNHTIELYGPIFEECDFVQCHRYYSANKARSNEMPIHQTLLFSLQAHKQYPSKPFFIGEFGFGQLGYQKYLVKDPKGIELHNSLWSSLFSGTMGPASFWLWTVLEKCGIHSTYKPVLTFCENLPILSETFTPRTTGKNSKTNKYALVFPNNIETYYMANASEDTLYGWCQDTAFAYQSLRRLTDKTNSKSNFIDDGVFDAKGYVYTLDASKKPRPSSKCNTIRLPITNQPAGTRYVVRWYDTETGLEIKEEATTAVVKGKALTFDFPSSIRNLRKRRINNTFGDAVFTVTRENKNGSTPESNAANKTKKFCIKKGINRQ